jgi:putative ABC transport system substrate-binding protein
MNKLKFPSLKSLLVVLSGAIVFFAFGGFKREAVYCKTVAIGQIVEHEALDETRRGIVDELKEAGYIPGKNINLVYETAQGDAVMANQIATNFKSLNPDVAIGIGTAIAQSLKQKLAGTDIPVVFSSVTDPVGSKLVDDLGPNTRGAVGFSNWVEVGPQLEKFQQICPNLRFLGVIYNPGEANSVAMLKEIEKAAKEYNVEVIPAAASVSSEVSMAARSLAQRVDAYFVSNDNTALSAFESIVKVANKSNLPVFVSDTDMVRRGAAAALGPNQYQIGRQTGAMVVQLLGGVQPKGFAVGFPTQTEFVINKDALAGIRMAVPEDIFAEAQSILPYKG